MSEDFTFWRNQLAGKNPELDDKLPRVGFYRKVDDPVMIRVVAGVMWAWIGRKGAQRAVKADASFAETTFSFFCRNAITSEVYEAVANNGEPWPDAPPDVKGEIGDNLPSDPFERLKIELEAHEERIALFLKTPISEEEQAVKCGLWSGKVAGLGKELDAMRLAEKRPHDEAGDAVQAKFKPKVDLAKKLSGDLKNHMDLWVKAKKRKAEAEEHQRQEAARKAAESLEMPAPQPTQTSAPSKVVTGGVSVRSRKDVKITDVVAAASFFAAREKVDQKLLDIITTLARREALAGYTVPGVEVVTIESVA